MCSILRRIIASKFVMLTSELVIYILAIDDNTGFVSAC